MSKVRAAKKTDRITIKQELARGTTYALNGKALFKYMDRSGWEQNTTALDFDSVMKKLKKFRKTGRRNAIIVDSGFNLRS
jgi:hypothetical protein